MTARTHYAPAVINALFEAVEMDDVVDPVVSLPDPIPVECTEEAMRACLDLCTQFWREGALRADMRALADTLLLTGDLPSDARRRYKLIRARYKHLRFALVLYGEDHRVPVLFGATVAVMGHLQDAYRNGRRSAVFGYALLLRLLLTGPVWVRVLHEVKRVRLDGADGFLRYRREEVGRLRQWLDDARLTAHRFHAMRKIVSRQVSFYDTMRTLQPDDRLYRMSRFLSAINGLMGSMHDDLVESAVAGTHDYRRDEVVMPDDIRCRLERLALAYPERRAA
ncbi:MAG: hypothetical protein QM681_04920 [Novosphingobium sp.]